MAIVRLRGQLERLAGGTSEARLEGSTVGELLRALEAAHPALEGWILDERGRLRPHINVFVGGERATPDTATAADDRIEILPAISGG